MASLAYRLILGFAMVLLGNAAQAQSGVTPEVRAVAGNIADSPGFVADATTCPADLMGTRFGQPLPEGYVSQKAHCTENPALCLADCQAGDSTMCFGLALVMSSLSDDLGIAETVKEMLYARACALGNPLACTNRAAGMRFYRALDPMSDVKSKGDVQICAHRSFRRTCEADNGWGCAMHGQFLKDGIGTAVDVDAADRAFDKACKISPDESSGPCKYARQWQAD